MEPLMIIGIPGLFGGLVIALVALKFRNRGDRRTASDPFARESLSTDVINAAHIRVAGVGGFGLVAMAAVVALSVPKIGIPLGIGAVSGVVLAGILILWRRRNGPMPSSGQRTGANTILAIDASPAGEENADAADRRSHTAMTIPAMRSRHA
jgi:hypothetical protein